VQVRRQAEIDKINVGICEQLFVIAVGSDSLQIYLFTRRAKIPLDPAPVAGELRVIARANRRELDSFGLLIGEVVNPAHEPDADDANAKHGVSRGTCLVFCVWCFVVDTLGREW
jgi:hypothetical protein